MMTRGAIEGTETRATLLANDVHNLVATALELMAEVARLKAELELRKAENKAMEDGERVCLEAIECACCALDCEKIKSYAPLRWEVVIDGKVLARFPTELSAESCFWGEGYEIRDRQTPSDEELDEGDFHPEAESQGRMARMNGFGKNDSAANPYLDKNGWMYRSFCAGWADAHAGLAADREASEESGEAENGSVKCETCSGRGGKGGFAPRSGVMTAFWDKCPDCNGTGEAENGGA